MAAHAGDLAYEIHPIGVSPLTGLSPFFAIYSQRFHHPSPRKCGVCRGPRFHHPNARKVGARRGPRFRAGL